MWVCTAGGQLVVVALDLLAQRQRADDLAGHEVGPGELGGRGSGLALQPRPVRHAGAVDQVVDDLGHDDLAPQRVVGDRLGEPLADRGREVGAQVEVQVGVLGQVGGDQLVGQDDLGPGHQHRQLGGGQPLAPVEPARDLAAGRQALELTVEHPVGLEPLHPRLVHVEQRGGVGRGVGQGEVLLVVVAQHQGSDLVGHLRPARALRCFSVRSPDGDDAVEQDLDVDLVVGGVDAGGVVDEVGVDPTAACRRTRCARAG